MARVTSPSRSEGGAGKRALFRLLFRVHAAPGTKNPEYGKASSFADHSLGENALMSRYKTPEHRDTPCFGKRLAAQEFSSWKSQGVVFANPAWGTPYCSRIKLLSIVKRDTLPIPLAERLVTLEVKS